MRKNSKIIIVLMLVPLLLVFMGFQTNGKPDWKLRKDKDGIKVYTRSITGGNTIEFKAITTLQMDIDQLMSIMNKTEDLHKWQTNLEEAKVLKRVSRTKWFEYSWIDLPWPFDNRDVVMLKEVTKDSSTGDVTISMLSKPEEYPIQDDLVRMNTAKGFWKIKKQSEGSVNVVYQFYADPEINMPKWLINMFIVDGPFETLTNLKELANK